MAKTTPTNVGRNSVLLFGDYGTEIMRLSQLYDPKQDRYQLSTDGRPVPGDKYFTIKLKDRTIYFEEIEDISEFTKDGSDTGEFRSDVHLWKDTGKECQNGYYVPVVQTMVVVDKATDKWGTYTLLIVDAVDPVTYESTLVPINFTGGVDTAARAVDWNNNLLNLFVDKITLGNEDGREVYKLTPDRKILAYGSGQIAYLLKKRVNGMEVILATDSVAAASHDAERFIPFSSVASFVDYRNANVTSPETFEALLGSVVQYYDADGKRKQVVVDIGYAEDGVTYDERTSQLYKELLEVYVRGEVVKVFADSEDATTRVQMTEPCYLRSSLPPLVAGEEVTLEVYENIPEEQVYRLITVYRVVVRDGVPLDPASLTKAQITGFNVKLYGNDTSDIWEIGQGTPVESLDIQPFLQLSNGVQVDVSTTKNFAFFEYGLEQIPKAIKGAEFDILFKYFPQRANGMRDTTTLDTRYIRVPDDVIEPDPSKQYFVKNDNVWELAGGDGHPRRFDTGTEYFTRSQKLSWQSVVSRPSRDFITCKKRVRIVDATASNIRKICVIPVWDNDHEKWLLKYLVYRSDYLPPKLIDNQPSEYGYVVVPTGEPDITVTPTYNNAVKRFVAYYKPSEDTAYWKDSETNISILLQHFTSNLVGKEKWLIAGKDVDMLSTLVNVYGRNTEDIHRPYIICNSGEGDSGHVYRIPIDQQTGFPIITQEGEPRNTFIEFFFDRALTDEDVTNNWANELTKPTHFRIRATDNVDEHATDWISIAPTTVDESDKGYANLIPVDGLGLPDPHTLGIMGIVIVEFASIINGNLKVLMGVPVEVRDEQATA